MKESTNKKIVLDSLPKELEDFSLPKESLEDFARCSREPEKVKYYIRCADKLVMDGLLPDDFMTIMNKWGFTDKDVKALKSVMAEFPNHSLNVEQMEWLEDYRSSIVAPDDNVTTYKKQYTNDLIKLFHGNIDLIDKLNGKSDVEIARLIKKWAKEKDGLGKPLIDNPDNYGYKTKFADALLRNRIVENKNFRIKL